MAATTGRDRSTTETGTLRGVLERIVVKRRIGTPRDVPRRLADRRVYPGCAAVPGDPRQPTTSSRSNRPATSIGLRGGSPGRLSAMSNSRRRTRFRHADGTGPDHGDRDQVVPQPDSPDSPGDGRQTGHLIRRRSAAFPGWGGEGGDTRQYEAPDRMGRVPALAGAQYCTCTPQDRDHRTGRHGWPFLRCRGFPAGAERPAAQAVSAALRTGRHPVSSSTIRCGARTSTSTSITTFGC